MKRGHMTGCIKEVKKKWNASSLPETADCVFNPFPNNPLFLRVCSTSPLKTPWEKEKLLVTAVSPFPTVFSTHLENFPPFSTNLKLSAANSFNF